MKTDLFHISQRRKLRVYVKAPEEYSQGIRVGSTADLVLAEFPGHKFSGKLVRTADEINVTTRTLLAALGKFCRFSCPQFDPIIHCFIQTLFASHIAFHPLNSSGPGDELRAQQTGVRHLKSNSANGSQANVDRRRREGDPFKVQPIAKHYGAV